MSVRATFFCLQEVIELCQIIPETRYSSFLGVMSMKMGTCEELAAQILNHH